MQEYMLVFRNEKSEGAAAPSEEQMKAVMQHWQNWIVGIANDGKYSGTNRLLSEGKTIRPGNMITDGPYVEAKEMIGGYVIVKTGSLDEAVEIARSCPNLIYGGNVEIRSVMPIDGDVTSPTFLAPKD